MTILGILIASMVLAFAALAFAGFLLLVKVVVWLVVLPFRLLWWLLLLPFLLLKAIVAGISLAFVVGLLAIAGLIALVAVTVAVFLPLLPVALIAFGVWLVVRDGSPFHRSSTARGQASPN